ncbi:Pol polyprotein [Elysia marginata]|uniref:Pol polyprotein n=1 Tax=Elysia marginata TaxID=1093978 RepID=A0AAV4JAZ0_9GAST|nr:Pol polyprotein [Elysia marginata]
MAHLFIHGVDAAFHLRYAAGDNITTSSTLLTSPALFSVQIFSQNTDSPLIFAASKDVLSKAVLLIHPQPDAPTSLTVDASNTAVGAQLEQRQGRSWVPLAFFSRKLSDSEKKYSAFDRELLASYSALKHFRHFLEGRLFTLYTDHKPLTFALTSQTDRSPRQTRHLSFIAEFTTDIQHIKGKFNVVADTLSRLNTIGTTADATNPNHLNSLTTDPPGGDCINFDHLAKDQVNSEEMTSYRTATTGLVLKDVDIGSSKLLCDISMGVQRPVLPTLWARPVFNKIHGLCHSGVRPSQKAIAKRFVWHSRRRDIRQWCKECQTARLPKYTVIHDLLSQNACSHRIGSGVSM